MENIVLENDVIAAIKEKSKGIGSNTAFLRRNYNIVEDLLSKGFGYSHLNDILRQQGLGYDDVASLRNAVNRVKKDKTSNKKAQTTWTKKPDVREDRFINMEDKY